MPSTTALLDTAALAAKLFRSPSRFRSIRHRLERVDGMPRPLAVSGHPVWLEAEIDAWLLARSPNANQTVDCRPDYELTLSPPDPDPAPAKRGRGRPRKNPVGGGAQ